MQSNVGNDVGAGKRMRVELENANPSTLAVTIEPWNQVYSLTPGDRLSIMFQGDEEGIPLVEHSEAGLTVYSWPGSTVAVLLNGVDTCSAGIIKVPRVPSRD